MTYTDEQINALTKIQPAGEHWKKLVEIIEQIRRERDEERSLKEDAVHVLNGVRSERDEARSEVAGLRLEGKLLRAQVAELRLERDTLRNLGENA